MSGSPSNARVDKPNKKPSNTAAVARTSKVSGASVVVSSVPESRPIAGEHYRSQQAHANINQDLMQ
jgi:serine acetyltransferase